jgi:hypothetical protein
MIARQNGRMPVPEERIAEVAGLYADARVQPFPSRLYRVDVEGMEMVMLDADVAGCVSSWLSAHGALDDRRRDILSQRLEDLDQVLPQLTDAVEIACSTNLRMLALLVCDAWSDGVRAL